MFLAVICIVAILIILELVTLATVNKRVDYSARISKSIVEPEEEFYMISELTNKKLLPLNYVRTTQNLPKGVYRAGISGSARFDEAILNNKLSCSAYLGPLRRITRSIPLSIPARGHYEFQYTAIEGGDLLGLYSRQRIDRTVREVTVVPRALDAQEAEKLFGGYMGDVSVRRFIMEDPVLTLGFRDYTGHEPMKAIAWTQTARTGRLQVKKYDYTLEATATVLVSIERSSSIFEGNLRDVDEDIERCLSITRGVCEQLEAKGIKYALHTNIAAPGAAMQLDNVVDGLGHAHLMSILEGLGRAAYQKSKPFVDILAEDVRYAEQGRSYIVIVVKMLDEYREYIKRLEVASGIRAFTLEVSGDACD